MLTRKHPDFSFDTEEDKQLIIKICKQYDSLVGATENNIERLNKALLAV